MLDVSSPFAAALPPGADSKNTVALNRLRRALVTCEIPPGSTFSEGAVADRFRLGRASVRVALTTLAASGFVTALPRQGWRSTPVSGALIGEVLAARRRLEPMLADQALGAHQRERLATLADMGAAVAGRDDPQAQITARATDRQMLDLLAGGAGLFAGRWLMELWDHSERIVHFLAMAGFRHRPGGRDALIAALAAGDAVAARAEIERDIASFQDFATGCLLRLPLALDPHGEGAVPRIRRRKAAARPAGKRLQQTNGDRKR